MVQAFACPHFFGNSLKPQPWPRKKKVDEGSHRWVTNDCYSERRQCHSTHLPHMTHLHESERVFFDGRPNQHQSVPIHSITRGAANQCTGRRQAMARCCVPPTRRFTDRYAQHHPYGMFRGHLWLRPRSVSRNNSFCWARTTPVPQKVRVGHT